jgi:FkbM family methyltransferase
MQLLRAARRWGKWYFLAGDALPHSGILYTRNMECFGLNPDSLRGGLILGCGAQFDHPTFPTICRIQGLNLHIRDTADLYLTDEIFRGHSYSIRLPENSVVVDVGMNSGLAALDFARLSKVSAVYGFEPFPKTFEMAMRNFALNPLLSSKIHAVCGGLAVQDESRVVKYSSNLRAGMTTRGVPPTTFSLGEVSTETIQLFDIVACVSKIFTRHHNSSFILKMDCEGDEYDLIPRLHETGLLKEFQIVMMEYHHRSPDLLIDILDANDFSTTDAITSDQILSQGKNGNMIYAAKDASLLE